MIRANKLLPQFAKNYYHLLRAFAFSQIYSNPSKKLKLIGVTGTDGKTTTTNLIYHILNKAGFKTSMISTVNAVIGNKTYDTGFHVTTPDSRDVQKYLKQMVDSDTEYAVLEVTSHALDQNRVFGLDFDIGVLTNITHEHLDYHKTYDNYLRAKARLFKKVKHSVLNRDDGSFTILERLISGEMHTYSLNKSADLRAKNIEYSKNGLEFDYVYGDQSKGVKTSLIGNFNVSNILASVSVARILGISDEDIRGALETFQNVPGRMEIVPSRQDFGVIIDFAHTPNAVENALRTARNMTKGKIIVCFGAAAERDQAKRPMMGKVAAKLADYVVLTNEDPRFEDPNKILTDIARGVVKGGGVLNKTFWMIEDRARAIKFSVDKAGKGDIVMILGKGHEKSISIKGREYSWSDKEAAMAALKH